MEPGRGFLGVIGRFCCQSEYPGFLISPNMGQKGYRIKAVNSQIPKFESNSTIVILGIFSTYFRTELP
jgi:hypothetical protein